MKRKEEQTKRNGNGESCLVCDERRENSKRSTEKGRVTGRSGI
jgi:hypothetical protein